MSVADLHTQPAATGRGTGVQVLAADHPSLGREVDAFLARLADERRFFGPSAAANPKPFPSLIRALDQRNGVRLAAVEAGRVVALVRIDGYGNAYLAVAPDRRAAGIGTMLGRAALDRAIQLGYTRVVLRSTRRSRAARRVGESLGCVVVEQGRGRTDLIIDLGTSQRSA
ncbi:MAG TPA: GNAT family N-acetyltransferase [Ilumatobacter sp.]|nr:GNAT family N-acetyltransferase [Ilumatobacter sp.]